MLSDKTKEIVKATVPALQAHGEAITKHFYATLLAEHPELQEFFNVAHQREGTQARALAGAVLAYASHIDRVHEIAPALPKIIQKHVALGIQPEHYPIVGECLLRAIGTVLGTAATDEVLHAWKEAYGSLASMLIAAEEEAYAATEQVNGGWRGLRAFRVARKEAESAVITSLYLEPLDGGPLVRFKAGQYLTLALDILGKTVRRNYSLSDAPGKPWYRISVKREPNGLASNWLHDQLKVGMEVQVQPPAGDFVLDDRATRPLVLVTGGVGITPAMSMLEVTAETGRQIYFIHAALNGDVHAFRQRAEDLASAHDNVMLFFLYDDPTPTCPPHERGRVSAQLLRRLLPDHANVDLYFLGPKPPDGNSIERSFMEAASFSR